MSIYFATFGPFLVNWATFSRNLRSHCSQPILRTHPIMFKTIRTIFGGFFLSFFYPDENSCLGKCISEALEMTTTAAMTTTITMTTTMTTETTTTAILTTTTDHEDVSEGNQRQQRRRRQRRWHRKRRHRRRCLR